MVTAERFGQGMTFAEYVTYAGSAANLRREATGGAARKDQSGFLREAYAAAHLSEAQERAWAWLARAGETPEQTKARAGREHVWRCAAVDETASMLYERLRVGRLA